MFQRERPFWLVAQEAVDCNRFGWKQPPNYLVCEIHSFGLPLENKLLFNTHYRTHYTTLISAFGGGGKPLQLIIFKIRAEVEV